MDWDRVPVVERLRVAALDIAMQLYKDRAVHPGEHHDTTVSKAVLAAAEKFFDFLYANAPVTHLALVPGIITKQSDGDFSRSPDDNFAQGVPMQIHDDEQVTFTVDATDAKNEPVTGEQITFTVDNPDILGLTVSADGASATIAAGTVGSGVLTATVGTVTATAAIDVIAGDATVVNLVAGDVTKQGAAPAGGSTTTA